MLKNKAQITSFIIIALLIIISASLVIYYFGASKKITPTEVTEEVPIWTQPIVDYVETCLHDTSLEAVTRLGEHGGYIDMRDPEISNENFEIALNKPTESDAVALSESSDPIPYWWYLKSENDCYDCEMGSLQPPTYKVENQIAIYVYNNLNKCLNKFRPFKEQGYDIEYGLITPEAAVADENIVVNLQLPITITKDKSTAKLSKFSTIIDVNLKQIFELGNEIIYFLSNNQSVEELTLDLLSYYSGTDYNRLPPIASVDHKESITTWQLDMVEMNIKDLLATYVQAIQFGGTEGVERIESDNSVEQGFFDKSYFLFLNKSYNLSADAFYLNWPVYLDITPRSGKMLKPRVDIENFPLGLLAPMRTNYYEFFYDLSYPVIIELRDKKALNEKGFSLFFAYEVNIRDNIDLLRWHLGNGTLGPWDYSAVNVTTGGISRATKKLFCKDVQKLSGNITIKVKYKNKPVEKAYISYGCGNFKTCSVSSTNEEGISIDTYPICRGGHLLVEKEGYAPKSIPYSTDFGKSGEKTVQIEPYRYFNVSVKKFKITQIDIPPQNSLYTQNKWTANYSISNTPVDLDEKDQVVITMSKIRQDANDLDHAQFVAFPGSEKNSIKLIPGIYDVTANLISQRDYIIKKACKVVCSSYSGGVFGHGCDGYKHMPEEDEKLEALIRGGLLLNAESRQWIITESDIDQNNNIEFYIIESPEPTCLDLANGKDESCCVDINGNVDPCCINPSENTMDSGCPYIQIRHCVPMGEMSKTQQYSNQYKSMLMPRFY